MSYCGGCLLRLRDARTAALAAGALPCHAAAPARANKMITI
jgi:hypothetical protein